MAAAAGEDFKRFRSWVALQRSVDTLTESAWAYYDYGPRDVTPLVMLPGMSGTADVFFRQFLSLCPKGYRLIAVRWPPFSVHADWIKAFDRFLDAIGVREAHLLGTALGGYLAQLYLQHRPGRVLTMVLCNTFSDTSYFAKKAPCVGMIPYMPLFVLQQYVLKQYPEGENEAEIAHSIDFMVNQVESLTQHELASRLLLHCTDNPLKPTNFERVDTSIVTIIDALDEVSFPEKLRDDVQKYFPDARIAPLKTGGNFPYISRPDEFNMHLIVHLRHHGLHPQRPSEDAQVSDAATSSA